MALLVLAIVLVAVNGVKGMYPIKYKQQVQLWAKEYDVDPYLVYAFMRTESSFNPNAESGAGARGLMQMTEDTFAWVKSKIAQNEDLKFDDLFNPDVSIRFGTYLIAISLNRYGGDISTAAAAYHSGWGTVDKLLKDDEYTSDGKVLTKFPYRNMSHYVFKINKAYKRYVSIYS